MYDQWDNPKSEAFSQADHAGNRLSHSLVISWSSTASESSNENEPLFLKEIEVI